MLWLISQFPELDHLDPPQRTAVLKLVPWSFYPRIVVISVCWGLFWFGVTVALTFLLPRKIGVILGAGVGFVVTFYLYLEHLDEVRTVIRREIARAFAGRRPPFCFSCGYDFRNLAGDVCPECGQSIGSR
jgi:hypothetical protein